MTPLESGQAAPAPRGPATSPQRRTVMEPLILLAFLVGWIALQVWVLPKMGVRT